MTSKPKLAFGLNVKKPGATKPVSSRPKPMFNDDDDDDDDGRFGRIKNGTKTVSAKAEEEIGGDFDDFTTSVSHSDSRKASKSRREPPKEPPKLNSKSQSSTMFGDLSSSLTSRRNAETAAELDANVYEYDSIYDSMKPKRTQAKEDEERKPKYMRSLLQAASVRKRDILIAEEKKIAREREAEGDEYAGKEKFVTEAYKKQQEENRRAEEEEKRREEEEAKKNKGGGMTAFYKKLLEKDEQRHAETVKAADEMAKDGSRAAREAGGGDDSNNSNNDEEQDRANEEAKLARDLNEKGASIAVNEDGEVVDKRQLLKGGLNVGAKKKEAVQREAAQPADRDRSESSFNAMRHDKKQAMRERQSRMLEEQLEQSLKRSRLDEQTKREEVERAAKSRKTEGDISSAKERYLARKKAAEEEKKKKAAAA